MDRPILFSAPMVRAILDDKKTQTRRLVKCRDTQARTTLTDPGWYPDRYNGTADWCMWGARGTPQVNKQGAWLGRCPYGQSGDRLWVRETWAHDAATLEQCRAAHEDAMGGGVSYGPYYRATEVAPDTLRWRPSIHMPRWASRITLEVTGVRVERLQDISDDDARAEGVERNDLIISGFDEGIRYRDYAGNDDMAEWFSDPVRSCRTLWESINGYGSWDANPWVWVVEFKRVNVEADHA